MKNVSQEMSVVGSLIEKYKKAASEVHELGPLRGQLESEAKSILSHLSGLTAEALVLPQNGAADFPEATALKLRSLNSVRTKLELLPGIRAKGEAKLDDLRLQLNAAVRALIGSCRNVAQAQMERDEAEVAAYLSKHYPDDADGASRAAAKAMQASAGLESLGNPLAGSNSWRWYQRFLHWDRAHDPLEDAETAVSLAESFDRGDPCT